MIETSEHSVNQPFRTVEAPNPPYGVPPPDVDPRPLRIPPPAAHPPSSRYSGQIRSPSHGSGERDGSRRPSRDPEKASTGYPPMSSHGLPSQCTSVAYTGEESEFGDEGDDVKRHAVWILIYLSALAPLLALPIAFYTLIITTLLLLLTPIFLILKQRPLSARYHAFLAPPRDLQLGLIFSSYETNPAASQCAESICASVFVNILAPVYAVFIAMAAWVGGIFWFYTAILGNPDGKEDRDDGREAVLTVRTWWERWLVCGMGQQ